MKEPQPLPVAVKILASCGSAKAATAHVVTLSRQQAFWKGGKRSAKLVGIAMLVLFPFGFLEPFLFMVWGSAAFMVLIVIVGPLLHLSFSNETRSFKRVDATCPNCAVETALKPYLSTRFEEEFTVLCPACGQTARVIST